MSENKPKLEKIWLDNTGTATCANRGDENRYVPYADYKKAVDALRYIAKWGDSSRACTVLQELGEDRGDG